MKNRVSRSIVASQLFLGLTLMVLLSLGSSAFAQNSTIFGPNVYVFTPSNSVSSINSTLSTLASYGQFDTRRAAVLFEPGTYTGVESEVGFYESIAGLGQTPSAVNLSQSYLESNELINGNDTQTFWRSMENMEMTTPGSDTLQWGVSQGASIRRMQINNPVELTDSGCNYSSGGFLANSKITGQVNSCSQQQWYTRNSSLGSWTGGNWNIVFSGVSGAPAQSNPFGGGSSSYTVLATTPFSREKPFLYIDSSSNYWVFSPAYATNTSGTTWANGGVGSGEAGTSLSISSFLIATPATSLATINTALASGKNLILTPGIYQYSGAINVTNANTVVLGLGYADLVPQTGTAALTVADVGGVQLAGFLIDAGPVNSPVLLQIGVKGATRINHATNPTSISDVHFRIGGATLGTCAEATEIDSDNVIIDNMWSWRADHGNSGTVGWTANTCQNGLVVNGDYVLATGLAIEHYQGEQVVWNGENGETIFYQSEMPYDVPSESAWMNGSVDGYASYNVSPSVTNHVAYGLGVYSVFDQGVDIIANSGIAAPAGQSAVGFRDAMTVTLSDGQTNYVIASNNSTTDNGGGVATSYVTTWGNTSGGVGNGGAGTTTTEGPYPSVAAAVPGTVMAENYDTGGQGIGYSVASTNGSANSYRSDGIDLEAATSPATGNDLGWSAAGQWFNYTVNVATAGTYTVSFLVASPDAVTDAFHLSNSSGTNLSGSVNVPATGGYQTWVTVTAKVTLPAGTQTLTLNQDAGGWNIDSMAFALNSSSEGPYGGTPAAIAGKVMNENYDTGGQGTGYSVSSTNGSANSYRSDGIDLEAATAPATGNDLGWSAAGQWFRYTVNVSTAGTYTVSFLVSNGSGAAVTDGFHLSNSSGTNLSGSVAVPNTGGWQTWATVTATVILPAGVQTLTLNEDAGGWNIDSMTFASSGGGGATVAIDSGGAASGSYVADTDFSGGTATTTTATISTAKVTSPAPAAVYQSQRYGNFTYTIPGFTAGSQHTVTLQFAETYWTAAGDRTFNVLINGTQVLTSFDMFANAGGENIAVAESFTATANSSGQIVIQFVTVKDNAAVNGIEVQ